MLVAPPKGELPWEGDAGVIEAPHGGLAPECPVDGGDEGDLAAEIAGGGDAGEALRVDDVGAEAGDLVGGKAEEVAEEPEIVAARCGAELEEGAVQGELAEGGLLGEGRGDGADGVAGLHEAVGDVLRVPLHAAGAVVGEASADHEDVHRLDRG